MKIKSFFLLIALFCITTVLAQAQSDNEVVATVGKLPISVGELRYAYSKMQQDEVNRNTSIADFLDTYVSYKRKIVEALDQKLDTVSSLQEEYKNSIDLLEKPYLNDTLATLDIAKVVFQRLKKNYKVKDLVVLFSGESLIYPEDTLKVYNVAKKIESEINKNGDRYNDVEVKYASKNIDNVFIVSRDYGWITSLMLVPLLEDEIYKLKKDEVSSKPIRLNDGYHFIKIEDERPDIGIIGLSSILLAYPDQATNEQKDSVINLANQIYEQLQSGTDFKILHNKYSSDIALNITGSLGTYGVQRPMSDYFKQAIEGVPVDGYSKPVLRNYGVHILRVDVRMDSLEWNVLKNDIVNTLNSSVGQYQDIITQKKIDNLSKKYHYKINNKIYDKLQLLASNESISSEKFREQLQGYLSEVLLSIDKRNYTVDDFLLFIKRNPEVSTRSRLTTDQLHSALTDFIYNLLLGVKQQSLENEYPILANISREYFEGLLYYSLMSKEVWDKAFADTKVLSELFNKNRASYNWDTPRFDGFLFFTKDTQTKKKVQDFIRKNKGSKNLISELTEQFNINGEPNVLVERGFWSKGENAFIDNLVYKEPKRKQMEGYTQSFVEGEFVKSPRNMNEVKGQVIEDYQKILEKQVDDLLSEKYSVEINQEILDRLVNQEK